MSDEKKRDKQTKPKNWVQRLAERFGYTKKVGEHKSSFEETKLGDTSVSILQDMKLQERMSAAAKNFTQPEAANKIAREIINIALSHEQ